MKFNNIEKEAFFLLEIIDYEALQSIENKIRGLREITLVIEQKDGAIIVEGKLKPLELSELELKYALNLLYKFSEILFYKKVGSVFKIQYFIKKKAKSQVVFMYKKAS